MKPKLNIDRLRIALGAVETLESEIKIMLDYCPAQYGYENVERCRYNISTDCIKCWSRVVDGEVKKEDTANAETKTPQTT